MPRCASFGRVQSVSLFPEDLLLHSDSCLQRMQLVYYVVYNNMLAIFGDNYIEILWSWFFWSVHPCCQKDV
jgi:hypothetical protein